jgi:hypothetical protein
MRPMIIALALTSVTLTPALATPRNGSDGGHRHGAIAHTATANAIKVNGVNAALRDLWLGHVFWVRNVVTAALAGDAAAQANAETQVVANAQAIAGSIEPFYGAAAKNKLFSLLAGHYGAVKAYLEATIAKAPSSQSNATDKLLANAKEIAVFLSSANPNLPEATVEGLFQVHGGHHIAQINELLDKDYAAEAKTWADITKHMYVIADALGGAIAKQFPAKFAAN